MKKKGQSRSDRKKQASEECSAEDQDALSMDDQMIDETDVESEDIALDTLTQERDEAIERYTRVLADYRNFQRRSLQNENTARIYAKADLVRSLLPVLNNLEMALSQDVTGNQQAESLRDGVSMVRDELLKALESQGTTRIEVKIGDPFDPMQHEAMMHISTDEVESGNIAEVLQPGYAIGEVVVRPAQVALAQNTDENEETEEE